MSDALSDEVKILAQQVAVLQEQRIADREAYNLLRSEVTLLVQEIRSNSALLTRGKGFLAGVAFVVVPLWTLVIAAGTAIWDKFFT